MDTDERLRSDAPFVADTSAWWRAATLPNELGSLQRAVLDDRFWIAPISMTDDRTSGVIALASRSRAGIISGAPALGPARR